MKTIILAGGYGTRLSEDTQNIPKPLVEVDGKPLLWYIMSHYASFGYNDFIIACGYKGDKIKSYFANLVNSIDDTLIDIKNREVKIINNRRPDWKVACIDTGLDTLTGGRLKKLERYIDGERFMMTYGDGVSDINIAKLIEFHKRHGKKATLTTVRLPRFGIITIRKSGKVNSFQEKRLDNSPFINGGFMVLEKSVLDYIEGDVPFESTPLERLANEGELYAYNHKGFWKCVDTVRDKQELHEYLIRRK